MQADLDFSPLKSYNDNYKHIFVVIDVLLKNAFTAYLKNKSSTDMIETFERVMPEIDKFQKPQTDVGREFPNSPFQTWLKQHHIDHYHAQNFDAKATIAERFTSPLKKNSGVILPTPTVEDMWKSCLFWSNPTTTRTTDRFDVLPICSLRKIKSRFGTLSIESMPIPN